MNLLLLRADELDGGGAAVLRGRRARHLLDVLHVLPGQRVRIGLLDGPLGHGEVESAGDGEVRMRCAFAGETPPRGGDVLLLAVPRPTVLARCLEHATALGFGRIVLLRSWRVDKSHLGSRVLAPARLEAHVWHGLEQSCRTRPPEIASFPLFRLFVEDHLDAVATPDNRFAGDPSAARAAHQLALPPAPLTLAIGPERGFTEFEVGLLARAGFTAVQAAPHPLRVETALCALHGQLTALRALHLALPR